ncbi:helix-turn-helix domain-containing protein [Actinoallomurus rhizosphaericola]|uniref:helix-turn-helix domain-containing protein n=1 Tax=Actinoallomurus rhizosphaericola TaxID=2952536 RepID=UPI0020938224|nr:helix-turn-helix transcriptional regulator [Actinoallomurus rhizosphaericola]MCO6000239.1 helix-turn-helix domain-containing protein [Actinoallomurus rhizosphaericola]
MVREPLSIADRLRGERLGELLREARGSRSITDVALRAGISPETLRKIERGRIPTPAFFTVVAVAGVLDLSLDGLLAEVSPPETATDARGEGVADTPADGVRRAAG